MHLFSLFISVFINTGNPKAFVLHFGVHYVVFVDELGAFCRELMMEESSLMCTEKL